MKLISLTQGKVAYVSDADYKKLSKHKLRASQESHGGKKWYAVRTRKKSDDHTRWLYPKIRMHHEVKDISPMDLPPGYVIDHVNNDSLDNRRCNLKVITQRENMLKCPKWKRKK